MDQRKAAAVLDLIGSGSTLSEACRQPGMPSRSTIYGWLDADEDFARRYERALERGGDAVADYAHHIAASTTRENASANRVILDALRWRASRLNSRYAPPSGADGAPDDAPTIDVEAARARLLDRFEAIAERLSVTPAAVISAALYAAGPLDFEVDRERILWVCEKALGPPPSGLSKNGQVSAKRTAVQNADAPETAVPSDAAAAE
jgi:hypothetical protein